MKHADVIRLAQEAGMEVHPRKGEIRICSAVFTGCDSTEQVERFAALVEAETLKANQQAIEAAVLAEREQCARLCDKFKEGSLAAQSGSPDALTNIMLRQVAELGHSECAGAIRARTQPMRIDDAHKE